MKRWDEWGVIKVWKRNRKKKPSTSATVATVQPDKKFADLFAADESKPVRLDRNGIRRLQP